MTIDQSIGLGVTVVLMSVGLLGSILPMLPSTPVVMLAAIGHWIYFREHSASIRVLVLLGLLTLLSLVMDHLASMFGAKKMGATWRGVLGAVVGAIVGLFFSLPGILLGPFIGAVGFELLGGREFAHATRAGVGAFLGIFLGALGKLICCLVMIGAFVISVVTRSGTF